MKYRIFILLTIIGFFGVSCQSLSEERYFETQFLGYKVFLPMTVRQAVDLYNVRIDSSNKWRFISQENSDVEVQVFPRTLGMSAPNDSNRYVYAISFLMKNAEMNQIQEKIEKEFNTNFVERRTKTNSYSSEKTYKFLKIDSPNFIVVESIENQNTKSKISFCHDLNEKEINLFIARDGIIWEDD